MTSTIDAFRATFEVEPGYLDWAAFGPVSPAVRDEVAADFEMLSTGRASSIAHVAAQQDETCALIARLLGAATDEVTLQPSATYGLMHAVYGLSGGVLASPAEFPNIPTAITRAADAFGRVRPQWLTAPDGVVTPEAVADALEEETAALVVSHVDFRTGYRVDLGALREAIGPDRLLIVDAVQSFGIVEADWQVADVVCGHGYKWLRAGRGTGFAWFGARARAAIQPVLSGFRGAEGGMTVDAVPPPAASAQAYTVSGSDAMLPARLAVALAEIDGVGVAAIEEGLAERTARVIEIAQRHDIPVVTPLDPARRAGIVALAPGSVAALGAELANRGVSVTTRSGLVRVAPHVGTDDETLGLLDDACAAFAQQRA
ncbi:aminotransferase class V-fold PLP-dependent enzyme [Microbacterium sp. JZ31]|uniref:aminotransferase class V-fold PLP-dependent enzyme n=1 Tax=Microbacterium sp. JZ31 TaxID=1906274 RepID=UPI0019319952|nr:aminotransferase class V-fold PLP-dependent enzyme [Microbacterium sp. JZ31]